VSSYWNLLEVAPRQLAGGTPVGLLGELLATGAPRMGYFELLMIKFLGAVPKELLGGAPRGGPNGARIGSS